MNPSPPPSSSDDVLIAAAAAQVAAVRRFAARLPSPGAGEDPSGVSPLFTADSFPGYDLVAERFRGGQGVVFEAIQKTTRRRVAIKVLHTVRPGDEAARRQRFDREVEILATLRHPNVVTVHDSAETAGRCYYVMDFVDGVPLDQWLSRRRGDGARPLSIREILGVFVSIADAVQAAHVRGVIHRDLKPGNVLVDERGAPRVVDFGLAKLVAADDSALAYTAMTATGQFVGSLPWASPEQLAGNSDLLDTRSDVYSLGVMLYAALTGRHPYPVTGSLTDLAASIRTQAPASFRNVAPHLDADLEAVVLRCLQKEPARRYQTAGELGADLTRYLSGQPIDAKRDSTAYLLRKLAQRYRWPLGLTGAFVVLIAVGAVATSVLWRQAATARDAARRAQAQADARFEEVRKLAHTFIFDLDDQIRELPGATTARYWAVQSALEYLDGLADEARDDLGLQLEIGQAYRRIGEILGRPMHPNLGRYDEARAALERSREILAGLLDRAPDHIGARRELAATWMALGDVQYARRNLAAAGVAYQAYYDEAVRVAAATDEPRDRREVAVGLLTLSDFANFEQRPADARRHVEAAAEILIQLPDDAPYPQDLQRDRSVAFSRLGDCLAAAGDAAAARGWYQRSNAIDEARYAAHPGSATARRDVTVGYLRIAESLIADKQFEAAVVPVDRALDLREAAVHDDPTDAQAQRDLATAQYTAGALYADWSEAPGLAPAVQLAHLARARAHVVRALESWTAMRDRGILQERDAGAGAELESAIAMIDQRLAAVAASQPAAADASNAPDPD